LRPGNLSKDKVPLNLVLKNVLSELEKKGEMYDEIWLIYALKKIFICAFFF